MVNPWHDLLTTLNDVLCLLATGHTDATAVQLSLIKSLQRALPHGQWALTHTWDGTTWQARISVREKVQGKDISAKNLTANACVGTGLGREEAL